MLITYSSFTREISTLKFAGKSSTHFGEILPEMVFFLLLLLLYILY